MDGGYQAHSQGGWSFAPTGRGYLHSNFSAESCVAVSQQLLVPSELPARDVAFKMLLIARAELADEGTAKNDACVAAYAVPVPLLVLLPLPVVTLPETRS
jgi:hypothetical protein